MCLVTVNYTPHLTIKDKAQGYTEAYVVARKAIMPFGPPLYFPVFRSFHKKYKWSDIKPLVGVRLGDEVSASGLAESHWVYDKRRPRGFHAWSTIKTAKIALRDRQLDYKYSRGDDPKLAGCTLVVLKVRLRNVFATGLDVPNRSDIIYQRVRRKTYVAKYRTILHEVPIT
jgi:hypothetical protein